MQALGSHCQLTTISWSLKQIWKQLLFSLGKMTNFVVPVLSLLLKLYKPDKDRMKVCDHIRNSDNRFSSFQPAKPVPLGPSGIEEIRKSWSLNTADQRGFSKEYLNAFIMVFMQVPDTTTITIMSSPSCPPIQYNNNYVCLRKMSTRFLCEC